LSRSSRPARSLAGLAALRNGVMALKHTVGSLAGLDRVGGRGGELSQALCRWVEQTTA
jgi:hypothetical protein